MKYINLGPNMWKVESNSEPGTFHYQSCHSCPFLDYDDEDEGDDRFIEYEEVHWICSCDAFSKSIPGPQNSNPLENPCKHINGLLDVLPEEGELITAEKGG